MSYARIGFGITAADIQNTKGAISIAQNPDALYGVAVSALNANPSIISTLSPLAKSMFNLGYKIVSRAVGEGTSTLGTMATQAVISTIGPEAFAAMSDIAAAVGTAVGDVIPVVNVMMGVVNVATGIQSAVQGPRLERVNTFFTQGAVQGTGYNFSVSGADLFAPTVGQAQSGDFIGAYNDRPRSVLGAVLAAITEDNDRESPVSIWGGDWHKQLVDSDTNLHHSSAYWNMVFKPDYFLKTKTDYWPDANCATTFNNRCNVGIPNARRKVYQNLRMAMGARGHDQGVTLLPIYLDMLIEDFDLGHLSPMFIYELLSTTYTDDGKARYDGIATVNGPMGVVGKRGVIPFDTANDNDQVSPLVDAVISLVNSWRMQRVEIAKKLLPNPAAVVCAEVDGLWDEKTGTCMKRKLPPMKLTFPPGVGPCLVAKGTWNPKYQTCTTVRAGKTVVTKWNPVTKSLTPPPVATVKTSPLGAVALGAAVAGAGVLVWLKMRRRRA